MKRSPPPGGYATTGRLVAWAIWDWACSPFFSVIVTFVFATYVTRAVAPDEISGTAAWGFTMTASALAIAFSSPILGALADAVGRRKPWLGALTLLGAGAAASLWLVTPSPSSLMLALGLVFVGNVALETAQTFYNAMLPALAEPARLGQWSGWGWGLGYLAGIAVLVLLLYGVILPKPPPFGLDAATSENVRLAGPVVAVWLLVFSLPLFLLVPDRPRIVRAPGMAIRLGAMALRTSIARLARLDDAGRFLLARMVYNDGLNTLFAFGGIYAAGTFGLGVADVIELGIALNIAAGVGAFAMGRLDDRIGPKRVILTALLGLLLAGAIALVATDRATFWPAAVTLGLFVGPAQASSRSLMARLARPEERTQMFGIYALSGKVTAFLGPFLLGIVTIWAGSQRAGMAVILALLALGAVLLLAVREPPRQSGTIGPQLPSQLTTGAVDGVLDRSQPASPAASIGRARK
jgi:UMF1 family MFS transporter